MRIHQMTVDEALKSLHSGAAGLMNTEAERRLAEFGPNRVEEMRKTSRVVGFLKGFTHFFALILWVASGLAFFAEWNDPGKGMGTLGFAIFGVILINGLFSFWQAYRAEKAILALQKLLPHEVKALRDQKVVQIPAEVLVPGDVILLEEGDAIPADCRLMEAFSIRVNTATVTGESLPKTRNALPSQDEDLYVSKNILLAGTSIISGEAKALVFATGMQTEFGRIARLSQETEETLSPMQKEIILLSRVVAAIALALGGSVFLIGRFLGLSFWENFIFAIGIIVASVPEGLLPTVTLALAMSSQRMARRNALIRHLPSVETLGSATVICTDKTGTLTRNRMEVRKLFFVGESPFPVEVGVSDFSPIQKAHPFFFEGASLCHNLKETEKEGKKELLGDPMEVALVQMAEKAPGNEFFKYRRLNEVPFDSDRKRLSILYETPQGAVLYTKGALESLLQICSQVEVENSSLPISPALKEKLLHVQEAMAEEGLRILAFAYRMVQGGYDVQSLEEKMVLSGVVGLEDPPRPEVPHAIQKCREAGIKVIMITGDHPHTARTIAREVGLVRSSAPVVITGDQLKRISDTQLQLALDAPEVIFARVGADQKLRIVTALKAKREIVAVTGDGVNDAPALKKADIGIAMGITGTDVARESADMILMDDNFASIVAAVEEGRTVFENIRKFLAYILTHELPEIVPYLAFALFKIPLPLTVVQILAVDLGTDTFPALSLGAERPRPEVMKKPPRSSNVRLLNWSLLLRAYLFLGVIEASAAMTVFFWVLYGAGWRYGEALLRQDLLYRQATTACLSAIIVMQGVNVFLCRSDRDSIFSPGFFGNPWLWGGLFLETILIFLMDYTPWGNHLFGTAPLPGTIWAMTLPFAAGMLVLEELRKGWVRRRG